MLHMRRKTAVVSKRNLLGKLVRGRLLMQQVKDLSREDLLDLLDMGYLLPAVGETTATNSSLTYGGAYFPRAIVVSSDQTVNAGDLVYWDDVHYTLKPLTAATQVAYSAGAGTGGFCGAAGGSANPNVYPAVPGGVPSENLPGVVVQRAGSVKVSGTVGDGTYFPFEPVTVGADAQTITRGGQTNANRVGLIIVPPPITARGAAGATPLPETLSGSGSVELWLEPKFPDTALL